MDEKPRKSICAVVILALSSETGMVGLHFKDNLECREPVNLRGCYPDVPDWLPDSHIEMGSTSTSSGTTTHATSGDLVGPGSVITGSALRERR